jgi:hypothetical protein
MSLYITSLLINLNFSIIFMSFTPFSYNRAEPVVEAKSHKRSFGECSTSSIDLSFPIEVADPIKEFLQYRAGLDEQQVTAIYCIFLNLFFGCDSCKTGKEEINFEVKAIISNKWRELYYKMKSDGVRKIFSQFRVHISTNKNKTNFIFILNGRVNRVAHLREILLKEAVQARRIQCLKASIDSPLKRVKSGIFHPRKDKE